jgi:hypothetical protein
MGVAAKSGLGDGQPLTILNINDATARNWGVMMNTTAHELGHHFLGHVNTTPTGISDKLLREVLVDGQLLIQTWGATQYNFRIGVMHKRYAAPVNPQAVKPR